jgi:hypothetical protein
MMVVGLLLVIIGAAEEIVDTAVVGGAIVGCRGEVVVLTADDDADIALSSLPSLCLLLASITEKYASRIYLPIDTVTSLVYADKETSP